MRKIDFLRTILLLIFFCFSSCNKEDVLNSGNENMNGDLIEIGVSVDGVEEFKEVPETRADGKEITTKHWYPLGDTCWMQATVTSRPMEKKVQTKAVLANIRFRVVAYQGGTIRGQGEYMTGGGGIASPVGAPLVLSQGKYDFLCYSYGKNDEIPELSEDNLIEVSQGTDLLWCKKANQDVIASGFKLTGIKFERKAVSIKLVVNPLATGFNVTECLATLSGLYGGGNASFNVSTGAITTSSLNLSGSQAFSLTSLGAGIVASQSSCILPQSGFKGTLTFDVLKVGDDYSGLNMVIPSLDFWAGNQYEIEIKILPFGILGGKTIMAPGILKRDGDRYFFLDGIPSEVTALGGTFFTAEEAAENPCQHVGTKWQLPDRHQNTGTFSGTVTPTTPTDKTKTFTIKYPSIEEPVQFSILNTTYVNAAGAVVKISGTVPGVFKSFSVAKGYAYYPAFVHWISDVGDPGSAVHSGRRVFFGGIQTYSNANHKYGAEEYYPPINCKFPIRCIQVIE